MPILAGSPTTPTTTAASAALAAGRRAAEALMGDACTITRVTGTLTDRESGHVTNTLTTIYSGKCKVQQPVAVSRPNTVGEAQLWMSRLEVHVPATVVGVQADDLVTITASTLMPDLAGQVFHVRDPLTKSFATAQRLAVEAVGG